MLCYRGIASLDSGLVYPVILENGMTMINHIPFGLRIEDQAFFDVADVPKGRQCGCICPSCEMPLIARQGKANRWHFAHASRNVDEVDKECWYSFFVSVRQMAKQILETRIPIMLPGWYERLTEFKGERVFRGNVIITHASEIILDNVKKESFIEEVMVDILGEVNGYPFVIYFTHPDRPLPSELYSPSQKNCGILEIKLNETSQLFLRKNVTGVKFIDELKVFLQRNDSAKNWIYHPRKNKASNQAKAQLKRQVENYRPSVVHNKKKEKYHLSFHEGNKTQNYLCTICRIRWTIFAIEKPVCPGCKNHLYAMKI